MIPRRERLPLHYWLILATAVAGMGGAFGGSFAPRSARDPAWLPPVSCACLSGMVAFGLLYCFFMLRDLRRLDVPPALLQPDEVVLLTSPGSVAHHRGESGGWLQRRFGHIGGRLFLTNQRLIFRTHWGQFLNYLLAIPAAQVRDITFTQIGRIDNGLCIETDTGQIERFSTGVFGPTAPWVGAIRALRQAALQDNAHRPAASLYSRATQALLHRASAISHARGRHGIVGAEDLLAVFLLEPSLWPPGVAGLDPPEVLRVIRALAPPLSAEAVAAAGEVPDAEEKLVLHQALEARTGTGPLGPHHVWAGVLRHNSKLVRAILRELDLDRVRLLEAAGLM